MQKPYMKRTTKALHTAAERLVEWWVGFHNLKKAGSNFKTGAFGSSFFFQNQIR